MDLDVNRDLLEWAVQRSGRDIDVFSKYEWLSSSNERVSAPIGQLEKFAKDARVSFGFLFLETPPDERLPLPDFRRMPGKSKGMPSPDLIDTIYLCQRRQAWYKEYSDRHELGQANFVNSLNPETNTTEAAQKIREWLGFDQFVSENSSWTEALSELIHRTDDAGVLVMVSGIVGNNTRRKLDPHEFRGFAIADNKAPLIFVNGADTKSAQMFTVVHELAHIWAGQSGVSDVDSKSEPNDGIERWCDVVAGEFLVPENELIKISVSKNLDDAMQQISRYFKVSTLVALRRLYDIEIINKKEYWDKFEEELSRLKKIIAEKKSSGGDFYSTSNYRVSKRFARALLSSTFEGETLYGEAMRLLSVSSGDVLERYAERLGVL